MNNKIQKYLKELEESWDRVQHVLEKKLEEDDASYNVTLIEKIKIEKEIVNMLNRSYVEIQADIEKLTNEHKTTNKKKRKRKIK